MPRLTQLTPADIRAVLDYVEWETSRIVRMRAQHPIQDDGHDHSGHGGSEAADAHDHSAHHHGEAGHGHGAGGHSEPHEM